MIGNGQRFGEDAGRVGATNEYLIKDEVLFALEVHMSEENLEVLITLDDPGEDAQDEDNFNHFQADDTVAHRPGQPYSPGSDAAGKRK
ncbi:MAG TPA: hypothetical protein VHQ95_05025 [Pyrinomonadaceae bacterium]|jgi:hypothetical protein|nr:hypothetical protein [Pyrinomonadaceae bacterium]